MDDLRAIADLLTERPPADDIVARGRTQLTHLVRQAPAGREPITTRPMPVPAGLRRRPSRRVLASAVAAALLLAGGVSYGLTASSSHLNSPQATATGLVAVSGCPGLYAAAGTLERVAGTSLIIKSFVSGKPLTLTTSAATVVNHAVTGSPSDITDGTRVFVTGAGLHQPALAANWIVAGRNLLKAQRPIHGHPTGKLGAGDVAVGTVTDAHPGGFSVTSGITGRHIPVTTSRSTRVITMRPTSLASLPIGAFLDAAGTAGPHATMAAGTIDQGSDLPIATSPRPAGCSSSAIATAYLTAG
jgi:hypothetical protein